jgi:Fur family transcriptional regulator, ferric uptake regulator
MIAATQSNHPLAGVGKSEDVPALEVACSRLRQAQMRVTKPRIAILNALINRQAPVAIEQLHEELKAGSCDLVTVYRCLAAFEEIGLVRRSFLHNGTSLYEIAFGGRADHCHVVCKSCGKVDRLDYFPVEGISRVLQERGYSQLSHIVEFFGVCPTCNNATPKAAIDRTATIPQTRL